MSENRTSRWWLKRIQNHKKNISKIMPVTTKRPVLFGTQDGLLKPNQNHKLNISKIMFVTTKRPKTSQNAPFLDRKTVCGASSLSENVNLESEPQTKTPTRQRACCSCREVAPFFCRKTRVMSNGAFSLEITEPPSSCCNPSSCWVNCPQYRL